MKNIKRISIAAAFIIFTALAFAQTAPPPNGGNTTGGGTTPVGGGAPIADGIIMLVSAALAYGLHKYKFSWQKEDVGGK